jgi:hypothetical protein
VGNRFAGMSLVGVQVENLLRGAGNFLIANNTFSECHFAFRLWDTGVRGKDMRFRNNLILGAKGPDLVFVDSGGSRENPKGAGDQSALPRVWQLDYNWREVKRPKGNDVYSRSWIPRGPKETSNVIREQIQGISRKPDADDYLRPARSSPLASAGAGKTDPSLPLYVGALPPAGVEPWDWDRTWLAPPPGVLVTVSKDPKDRAGFRTIKEGLHAAKPWATVRVLDDASYPEALVLEDPAKQKGIALEAPRHATIALSRGSRQALAIQNVPYVKVKGFRFREASDRTEEFGQFVFVSSHTPGVVLEELDMEPKGKTNGIALQQVAIPPHEAPLVVKGCNIRGGKDGILVISPVKPGKAPTLSSGILIYGNQVSKTNRGIQLQGALGHCQITGNLVWSCRAFGLQIEDLEAGSREVLIANNTAFGNLVNLSFWDNEPHKKYQKGQVEVRANWLFEATEGDMIFVLGKMGLPLGPGNGEALTKLWRFGQNCRDLSGDSRTLKFPVVKGDTELPRIEKVSRKPEDEDFMRPKPDSPPAKGGAGKEDPSLPTYVGAVPPKGALPWDWKKTWNARAQKTGAGWAKAVEEPQKQSGERGKVPPQK